MKLTDWILLSSLALAPGTGLWKALPAAPAPAAMSVATAAPAPVAAPLAGMAAAPAALATAAPVRISPAGPIPAASGAPAPAAAPLAALSPAPLIPEDSMPIPPPDPKQLFYVQRTPNANTIICDLNEKDGVADPENPVHVYWLRYTENQKGHPAELSYIQRTFAYGIKARALSPDKYELHFVSYKKYSMYLEKAADHRYHVFAMINGKVAILQKIFVEIRGGSFWTPHVEYVQLRGLDPSTGKAVEGRINV